MSDAIVATFTRRAASAASQARYCLRAQQPVDARAHAKRAASFLALAANARLLQAVAAMENRNTKPKK